MTPAKVPYRYSPLDDPRCNIRLLSITHADEELIQCCLTHVGGLSHEPYTCLSYTWGDPFGKDPSKTSWTIYLQDDSCLTIGQNLRDALLSLFRVQRDKLYAIWIDAVCIDQGNAIEIPHQIRMMHDIYSHAETVLIWLGPDDPSDKGNAMTRHVIRVVMEENADMKQREAESRKTGDQSTGSDGETETPLTDFDRVLAFYDKDTETLLKDMVKLSSIDGYHWRAVSRISHRAYWARLWIWQEVIASRSDPIVVCGDTIFIWSELCLATHYLVNFGITRLEQMDSSNLYLESMMGSYSQNQPYRIANMRARYANQDHGTPWMRRNFGALVLQNNRNDFACSDERDRLFAHVGLCNYERLSATDYTKPFWVLYRDFWADVLERSGCIDLLTYVEDASARLDRPKTMRHDIDEDAAEAMRQACGYIPTWVPDLRARLEPVSMYSIFQKVKAFDISANLPNDMKAAIRIDRDTNRLFLRGYKLDMIAQFAECYTELRSTESIPGLLELVKDLLTQPSVPYDRPAGAMDAVLTSVVLLAHASQEQQFPVPAEIKTRCRTWFLDCLARARIRNMHNDCTVRQDALLRELEAMDTVGVIPSLQEVQEHSNVCRDRINEAVRKRVHSGNGFDKSCELMRKFGLPIPTIKVSSTVAYQSQAGSGEGAKLPEYIGDFGLSHMRLFRTMQGWVGKGPQSLQAEDELWLLPEAKVAFVLRRHSDDSSANLYTYVGHAYVHGLMSGEFNEKFRRQQPENIVLV